MPEILKTQARFSDLTGWLYQRTSYPRTLKEALEYNAYLKGLILNPLTFQYRWVEWDPKTGRGIAEASVEVLCGNKVTIKYRRGVS